MDRYVRTICAIALCCLTSAGVAMAQSPAERYRAFVSAYGNGGKDLSRLYPHELQLLYQKVKGQFSLEELKTVMSKEAGTVLDDFHMEKVLFIASPKSVSMQRQQHIDWVPKLVNDETLAKGEVFFKQYSGSFRAAYEKTGVKPQDILAVLNWESRLGEHKGAYYVLKIFVAQAFYLDEVENRLYKEGAYREEGVMPRNKALERVQRIKERALNNLAQLLIQAKQRGFDPYAVKGSWAGAIGIPQFMPASMSYAADGNGDGIIDLNTVEDSIMSVGNYLQKNGYHARGARHAFKRYNSDEMYMRGVALYSDEIHKRGIDAVSAWDYRGKK